MAVMDAVTGAESHLLLVTTSRFKEAEEESIKTIISAAMKACSLIAESLSAETPGIF